MNTTNSCGNSQLNSRKSQFLLLIPLENQTLPTVRFSCFLDQFISTFSNRNHSVKFQDLKLSTKKPRCKLFCKIQHVPSSGPGVVSFQHHHASLVVLYYPRSWGSSSPISLMAQIVLVFSYLLINYLVLGGTALGICDPLPVSNQ